MMANRVRPGTETLRKKSGILNPLSRMELGSAETIKASGSLTPHQQAGHKTAPNQTVTTSKRPCNAGAIHTGLIALR
jgi:hypothetical protein